MWSGPIVEVGETLGVGLGIGVGRVKNTGAEGPAVGVPDGSGEGEGKGDPGGPGTGGRSCSGPVGMGGRRTLGYALGDALGETALVPGGAGDPVPSGENVGASFGPGVPDGTADGSTALGVDDGAFADGAG